MCTISFIARQRGYLLAMNRDEKLSRAQGLPPKPRFVGGCKVICPSEPGGGTWIALNGASVTFALINWYAVKAQVKSDPVSRGVVVDSVSAEESPVTALEILAKLPLVKINPFRLVGIFPATEEVFEWCWDLKKLVQKKHRWHRQQFISSGFDESMAQRIRSQTFRRALRQKSAGTLDWLRQLHRSDSPESGPFSICMRRPDAATVSRTEITVSLRGGMMSYHNCAPCDTKNRAGTTFTLDL